MLDGLKTFPIATEQTDGEKMIEAEFGIKGYAVLMKLYQAIYSRGYYMKWDIDTKLLFIRDYYLTEVGGNLVSEIVTACVRRGVFDSALYEQYQILTSSRIEETFLTAKQRSTKVIMDKNYALPIVYTFIDNANKKGKNVNIFFKNVDSLSTFSDKGKERKEKESKGENIARTRADSLSPLSNFIDKWGISANAIANYRGGKMAGIDWDKVSEMVDKSTFLKGIKNISFFVDHYEEIIDGKYTDWDDVGVTPRIRNDPDFDTSGLENIKYD